VKKVISLTVTALVIALGSVAFASEVHQKPGQCNAFERETAVWSWDSTAKKFVFEGYTCKPQGGR
jgi:hypothetical protein